MAYFDKFQDDQMKWRWTLRDDGNHEAIATSSESYNREADCDAGIAYVKKHAATAPVRIRTRR